MISIGQKVHPKSVIYWTQYIPYLSLRDTWGLLNCSENHHQKMLHARCRLVKCSTRKMDQYKFLHLCFITK